MLCSCSLCLVVVSHFLIVGGGHVVEHRVKDGAWGQFGENMRENKEGYEFIIHAW